MQLACFCKFVDFNKQTLNPNINDSSKINASIPSILFFGFVNPHINASINDRNSYHACSGMSKCPQQRQNLEKTSMVLIICEAPIPFATLRLSPKIVSEKNHSFTLHITGGNPDRKIQEITTLSIFCVSFICR